MTALNAAINVSLLLQEVQNATPSYHPTTAFTTQDLLNLCGSFSNDLKTAAIIGLVVSFLSMAWFGKYRGKLQEMLRCDEEISASIDKAILMITALLFGFIITRLFYGG